MTALPPNSWDPVSDKQALTVDCLLCGRPAGKRCVYMADSYWPWQYGDYGQKRIKHRKGTQTARAHNPRRRMFAEQRLARWKREHKAEAARLEAVTRGRRAPIASALAEFDRREHDQMKAWLREHGHILWEDHLIYQAAR